ncbi:MAG: ATP-binding protein [Anaerolineae bacterium]|jgi:signal transduction histidine kinase
MTSERILVVDDEPQIVRLCIHILGELGYRVRGAQGGEQALQLLSNEAFDILLADIKMPDIDGIALLKQARALDPNLTAVIITGYATMDRAIDALHAGARGFVLKPFGVTELTRAVEQAIDQRRRELERIRLEVQLPIWEISQALLSEGDVRSMAGQLLEVTVRQLAGERAVLALFDEPSGELYVAAELGLAAAAPLGLRFSAEQGPVQDFLSAGEPTPISGELLQSMDHFWPVLAEGLEDTTLVSVPLRTSQKPVGLLALGGLAPRRPGGDLSSSDLNLLSIVGRQIAIALENMRMYALEQQRTAELERALAQQRELDRLKDEFIRNVSHELRTPLAMILGYAELLAEGVVGETPPEQAESLRIVVERARSLTALVENITTTLENKGREPFLEPVSLSGLVHSALTDFRLLAHESDLTLTGEIAPELPPVMGDLRHLRKIVDNLIDNALKFTPAGGQVQVSLVQSQGNVLFSVSDTGIGIPAGHQERIFDRFYQVDGSFRRVYGGSGLGLALVKEIVETHRGAIRVQSEPGKGSTFTVALPAAPLADP